MNRKRLSALLLAIFALVVFTGCSQSPKGNPDDVLNSYFQAKKDSNYEKAYNLLCEDNKMHMDKDKHIVILGLMSEYLKLKDFKYSVKEKFKDFTVDNITYPIGIEYDVTVTHTEYDNDNKETTQSYITAIVSENGQWKVLVNNYDTNVEMSNAYNRIGWMYATGKGKEKLPIEAAANANKAIECNPQNAEAYYLLGYAYIDLERYEDAIKAATSAVKFADDNNLKSDCAVIMGLGSEMMGELEYAEEFYLQALDFDPQNEYAKTHLASLQ